ncbi:MAG: O-antigen ligase family protein, partial [bacterium]
VSPAISWRGEYENFAGSLTQLNYAALYFLTVQFADLPDKALVAVRALLAAALCAALYALMQALGRDYMPWSAASTVANRFFGTLGNPNFLGGLMAMAIPLKLGLAWEAWGKEKPEDKDAPWRLFILGLGVLTYLAAGRPDLLNPLPNATSNLSGGLILCFWLCCLGLAPLLRRLKQPKTAFFLALTSDLLLFFQALANTGTRGAFLGLMVGLAVLAVAWSALHPSAERPLARRALRGALGLGLLALALGLAFAGLGSSFRQRTLSSLKNPEKALEVSRLEIWGPALEIWKDHPIAGTGVDTFKTVFPKYSHARFADYDGENVSSRMAHCEPLQILATQGAVGLALWLWLCAAAFAAWWRRLRGCANARARPLLLGLGALLAAYLAQNLVSFGVAGISVPYWACLGLLFCDADLKSFRLRQPPLGLGWALLAGSLLALGGLWLDGQTLRADLDYAFASTAQSQLPDLNNAPLDELRGAVAFAQDSLEAWTKPLPPDLASEAESWDQEVAAADTRAQDPSVAPTLAPFYRRAAGALLMVLSAARLEEAVHLCPEEVKYRVYLGLCYEELFQRSAPERRKIWFQAADKSYTLGVALNPDNAYYHGNLGRLWGFGAEAGSRDYFVQAQIYYLQAVDLAPVTRLFYKNLLQMQARYADAQDADSLLAVAIAASPRELAPRLLLEAASTFYQYRDTDLAPWDAAAKAAAKDYETRWAAKAVALEPTNADDALALAVFELQGGRRDQANQWAHRALALNPKLAAAAIFLKENRLH